MKTKLVLFLIPFAFLFIVPFAYSQNQSLSSEEIEAFEKAEECRKNVDDDNTLTFAQKIVARDECDDKANELMVGSAGVDTKSEEIREDRQKEILKCEEWHSQYQTDSFENFMILKDVAHAHMCISLYNDSIWGYDGDDRIDRLVEYSLVLQNKSSSQTSLSNKFSNGSIKVYDTDLMIDYEITSGKVSNAVPNVDLSSLIIGIDTTTAGSISLELPRTVIDAKINDEDDTFFVLVDGEEVEFKESTTETHRTVIISFPAYADEIEIIGSFVVPEFGTITIMILFVAIMSVITMSAKTRLKYDV